MQRPKAKRYFKKAPIAAKAQPTIKGGTFNGRRVGIYGEYNSKIFVGLFEGDKSIESDGKSGPKVELLFSEKGEPSLTIPGQKTIKAHYALRDVSEPEAKKLVDAYLYDRIGYCLNNGKLAVMYDVNNQTPVANLFENVATTGNITIKFNTKTGEYETYQSGKSISPHTVAISLTPVGKPNPTWQFDSAIEAAKKHCGITADLKDYKPELAFPAQQ